MSAATTVILSAAPAWSQAASLEALLAEFGCEQVIDAWDPHTTTTAGALHLTATAPGELRKILATSRPWLLRSMVSRGWAGVRQLRQQHALREAMHGTAGALVLGVLLGVVGPAIDAHAAGMAAEDMPQLWARFAAAAAMLPAPPWWALAVAALVAVCVAAAWFAECFFQVEALMESHTGEGPQQ